MGCCLIEMPKEQERGREEREERETKQEKKGMEITGSRSSVMLKRENERETDR